MSIDWTNPKSKISKYFTVHEATWLPSWKIYHIPSEQEKQNIIKMAEKMDMIRELLGAPINVHVWIRPGSVNCPGSEYHGKDYNAFVKGAKNSAHKLGRAVDYDAKGMTCDEVRSKLEPILIKNSIRMEKMPGGSWVHNDDMPVPAGGNAYFLP